MCLSGALALLMLVTGCTAASTRGTPASSQPSASRVLSLDHVVIIVEENQSTPSVIGTPDAPYLTKLALEFAIAENYRAVTHPSLPNYLALTGGTTAGIASDCSPADSRCQSDGRNIADELEQSRRTWKMYAQTMPAPCTTSDSGLYAAKHNPFVYYVDIVNDPQRCATHVVPYRQFDNDLGTVKSLPDYSFISPNLCNDMHSCPIATGDAWLAQEVPKILKSPAFTKQNSLLVITWDEGRDGHHNNVATIFAGPAAKRGFASQTAFTHYSLLRTIEDAWGLEPLTEFDRSAVNMNEMLKGH